PEKLASPNGLWLSQSLAEPRIDALPGQRSRWQQTFRLEPLSDKEVPLQIAPLRFREGKAERWREQSWESIPVKVTTSVEESSLKALRDITPIEQLPAPPNWRPTLIGIGLGAAVCVLLGVVVWRLRPRPVPPPELTPTEWALRELDRID